MKLTAVLLYGKVLVLKSEYVIPLNNFFPFYIIMLLLKVVFLLLRGVAILKRDGDERSASGTYKGTCTVKVPLDYLLQYCHTLEFRNEFDTLFESGNHVIS